MTATARADPPGTESEVLLRTHPGTGPATLIYLPGTHGDWTLIGSFRRAIAGRIPFAEITYPRTLTWSFDDHAANIEAALLRHGITGGWLLGESFGSQVAWALARRSSFETRGMILAGGFVRHPAPWAVRIVESVGKIIPLAVITAILFGYAKIARLRFRKSPEVAAGIQEFIARRTELDKKAAMHRLRLIFQNDPRQSARNLRVPLYAIAGGIDPLVPWFLVWPWLRKNCSSLRECHLVPTADHNVLGTAPDTSAEVILKWIAQADHPQSEAQRPAQI